MKKYLLSMFALLLGLNCIAAKVQMVEVPPDQIGTEHKGPATLPIVDYYDDEVTICSPFIIYNVEIVIKDAYGSVLYYEAIDELDYTYPFLLDEEDFNSMYSIELIYGSHHLYGYFV